MANHFSQPNKRPGNNENTEIEQPNPYVVASITQMFGQRTVVPKECSIYRVPRRLIEFRRMAYTPQLISIGPFHHGREDLMAMEQLKLQCFHNYLLRINFQTEDIVRMALSWKNWERKARDFYAEPINMSSKEFVKMMLIDGCFIIELMIHDDGEFSRLCNSVDFPLYQSVSIDLYRDLTMLENQVPFFVLEDLFKLSGDRSFVKVTHRYFEKGSISMCKFPLPVPSKPVLHLLHFLSLYYFPSRGRNVDNIEPYVNMNGKLNLPPTATELFEAGVSFKKLEERNEGIADIRFENGVLKIPPFQIHDVFETYLRNLMVFEHFPAGNCSYAIHYVAFLDGLISTERDASLLVKAEIIRNHIGGSDKEVSVLFNGLCKEIAIAGFHFDHLSDALHQHCKRRRHRWMTSLRRDYFYTPWASISFIGATLLIFLTFLQTIFSGRQLRQS